MIISANEINFYNRIKDTLYIYVLVAIQMQSLCPSRYRSKHLNENHTCTHTLNKSRNIYIDISDIGPSWSMYALRGGVGIWWLCLCTVCATGGWKCAPFTYVLTGDEPHKEFHCFLQFTIHITYFSVNWLILEISSAIAGKKEKVWNNSVCALCRKIEFNEILGIWIYTSICKRWNAENVHSG